MRTSPYIFDYRITQHYSATHTAYDMVGKTKEGGTWIGAPIHAVEAGTVWYVWHWRGTLNGNDKGGNFVIVKSANRFWYYGHLKNIAVKTSQVVTEGTYLGSQGATGLVSAEHLHFELSVGSTFASGTRINPLEYIKKHTMTSYTFSENYIKDNVKIDPNGHVYIKIDNWSQLNYRFEWAKPIELPDQNGLIAKYKKALSDIKTKATNALK